ncbi:restriction endonuclease subunit S [uncultured Bacteroides sp.]|nr:restriction endonuclease subunit S [uncultured Bacteroides sp.]
MRIKDFTTKVGSGITPRGGAEVYQSEGIPLFRSQNITNEGLLLHDIAYISEEIHKSMSSTRLKPNDVLLNITGASIGRCYYLPNDFTEGNVNQHVCIIRSTSKVLSLYLYYCLVSDLGQQKIYLTQTGANREGLTKEDISNFEFDIPSFEEQGRIVSYLNDKVGKIDDRVSLLSKKRDAYLKLKKALISRVVTKGLNPNARFKPSGVDWIGEIPEGWELKRIKDVVELVNEKTNDTSLPYIALENIESWTARYIPSDSTTEGTNSIFHSGDVLFGKLRPYLAKGYLPKNDGICSTEFFVLRPYRDVHNKYILYFILSHQVIDYLKNQVAGVKMPRTNWDSFANLTIPLPHSEEQQSIASYLDEKCSEIDANITNLEKQIEKYKELKRALISEVVTGKRTV